MNRLAHARAHIHVRTHKLQGPSEDKVEYDIKVRHLFSESLEPIHFGLQFFSSVSAVIFDSSDSFQLKQRQGKLEESFQNLWVTGLLSILL